LAFSAERELALRPQPAKSNNRTTPIAEVFMKVRTFGFIWEPKSGKGLDEFMECVKLDFPSQMKSLERDDHEPGARRLLILSRFGDVWAGVFLTIKNARRFITSQTTEDGLNITTQYLEENNDLVDVNLFTVNPQNGIGLYQFYQGSAHITAFGRHCDNLYIRHSAEVNREARLRQSSYLNPSDYAARLETLKSVNNVEYEFTTLIVSNDMLRPASGHVKREKFRVFFDYRNSDTGLIAEIAEYAKRHIEKLRRFNIEGRDYDGNEVTYRLDQPSVFSEMEFDDFQIDFKLKHQDAETALQQSHSLRELLKLTTQPGTAEFFNSQEVKE
jgi:hypothetical protein